MKNTILKSIFMAFVGCFSAIMAIENPSLSYIMISSISFILTYMIKDSWIKFKSDSKLFGLNKKDVINGLIIALSMALSTYAATLLVGIEFDLAIFFKSIIYAVGGYLSKTFIQNSQGELLTLDKKSLNLNKKGVKK